MPSAFLADSNILLFTFYFPNSFLTFSPFIFCEEGSPKHRAKGCPFFVYVKRKAGSVNITPFTCPFALENKDLKRFEYIGILLRVYKHFPLIELSQSFEFTEKSSSQRLHGEPSPSQRRRLAKSMTSLRQLVKSKGEIQSIPKCASDNPIKRFSKSPKSLQKIPSSAASKAVLCRFVSM